MLAGVVEWICGGLIHWEKRDHQVLHVRGDRERPLQGYLAHKKPPTLLGPS